MKLFKKLLIIFFIVAGFFLIKSYQPTMNIVYPKQCSFLLDEQLAPQYKTMIQEHILKQYEARQNPYDIVQEVTSHFPEIESMHAYICETDKLCFSCDAAKPLFALNDQYVVTDSCRIFAKNHYRNDVALSLYHLTALSNNALKGLVTFFKAIPKAILEEFDISWIDKDEILLQQKNKHDVLLFSEDLIPAELDITYFKKLQSNAKQGKKRVYDFRFQNQIIVR